MNAYAFLIRNRRAAAVLVACTFLAAGCGGSRLTEHQAKIFTDRVAPELERVLRALEATNASPVGVGRPLRPDDAVCTHTSIDGSVWAVHRDGFAYTLELRPPASVNLLSMVRDDPRIQQAVAKLQERLAPAGPIDPSAHLRAARQLGDAEDLNARISNPTNELRRSANQIRHIAQALGYQAGRGGVTLGKDLGVVLHYGSKSPGGLGLTEENSGGYVGLYSASTNLDSVDLVVFMYRGKVEAILQRAGPLTRKPGTTSVSSSP